MLMTLAMARDLVEKKRTSLDVNKEKGGHG
jgi:hypothetical protein